LELRNKPAPARKIKKITEPFLLQKLYIFFKSNFKDTSVNEHFRIEGSDFRQKNPDFTPIFEEICPKIRTF
jgi:hypothetical protein